MPGVAHFFSNIFPWQETAWTCAICNIDTIDEEFYNAVRINKPDVYKQSSEGDDFMTLILTWMQYDKATQAQKLSLGGGWQSWLSSEFGIDQGKAKRFLQILRRPYWIQLAIRHNRYAWGRESWLIQHFTDASAQGCDEVRENHRPSVLWAFLTHSFRFGVKCSCSPTIAWTLFLVRRAKRSPRLIWTNCTPWGTRTSLRIGLKECESSSSPRREARPKVSRIPTNGMKTRSSKGMSALDRTIVLRGPPVLTNH